MWMRMRPCEDDGTTKDCEIICWGGSRRCGPVFPDFEHDGVMWTGDGAHQIRAHVEDFSESFRAAPILQVNLSMWDIAGR
jgi:hypothetical protein